MFIAPPVSIPPESLRPQFHFTAQTGWLNDPNGLVYENGKYHLFYQHNPFGTEWGNMTWGHAVSADLMHWKHLPNALAPDSLGTMFSGSAILDKANTAGFGKNALICMYTAAGGSDDLSKGKPFTQCLAYSLDGIKFTKFSGNPVLPNLEEGNRDPKVIWYVPAKHWVMALYLRDSRYALFSSPDLKHWTKTQELAMPGTDECPDFFEMGMEGEATNKQWIFWGANGNYQVGQFDGNTFRPHSPIIRSNFGNTSYAAQTYSNAPKNRRIQIAWMNNSNFPGCTWNQQMTFPTNMSLRSTPEGPRLAFWPVSEVRGLRVRSVTAMDGFYDVPSGLLDAEGDWTVPAAGILTVTINGIVVKFDAETHILSALDKSVTLTNSGPRFSLRVLADRTSLEIFAQNGLTSMPLFFLPRTGDKQGIDLKLTGKWSGKLRVYELHGSMH